MNDPKRAVPEGASLDDNDLKARLRDHAHLIKSDPGLLAELGLRLDAANVVDFGPVALSRVAAAHRRESSERKRLETVSRANFAAQTQTHASVIHLIEADGHADLARRVDEIARLRFGLVAGMLAVEGPERAPEGWRPMAQGQVRMILGPKARALMGHVPTAGGLFAERAREVASVALVRLEVWNTAGILAFGAGEGEVFAADMGADLITFLARVTALTAQRWDRP